MLPDAAAARLLVSRQSFAGHGGAAQPHSRVVNCDDSAARRGDDNTVKSRIPRMLAALALVIAGSGLVQARGGGGGGGYGGGAGHGGGGWSGGSHGGGGWGGGGGGWHGHGDGHHHGSHGGSVGIYFGPGYWGWPYYAGYPGYYDGDPYWDGAYGYPYSAYGDPTYAYEPPVYVEHGEGAMHETPQQPVSPAPVYWFYCSDPAGWYPYVPKCNQAWRPTLPQDVPAAPDDSQRPTPAR